MKLRCEILEVVNNGDCLTIGMQAKCGRADWKPIERQTLRIDNNAQNRKTFYVGRVVTVEIKP